jgi:hypothetical protein
MRFEIHGRRTLRSRILKNRYDPGSRWVSLGDVVANLREVLYRWSNRVPPDAVIRWSGTRIVGHSTKSESRHPGQD